MLWNVFPVVLAASVGVTLLIERVLRYTRDGSLPSAANVAVGILANTFFIGFLTELAVSAWTRQEAKSGRVPGRGRGAFWIRWFRGHSLASAGIVGGFSAASVAAAVDVAFHLAGAETMTREQSLSVGVVCAAVTGLLAATVAAFLANAAEPDVSNDPRWCRSALKTDAGIAYPCQWIDKAGLAMTDRERGCSCTPTWQLIVRGVLEPDHVRRAFSDLVTRYPSLATKVQSLDGVPEHATRFRYAYDPSFRVDQVFEHIDVRDEPTRLAALIRELQNRHTDPFTDFPVTLTHIVIGSDACQIVFRQHHVIADGLAFIELLGDFAKFLETARRGERPPPEALEPIHRGDEIEVPGLSGARCALWTAAGFGISLRALVRAGTDPIKPLLLNRNRDCTGDNAVLHWLVPDDALGPWKAAARRHGVGLNSLLTAALIAAIQRWHRARGISLGRTMGYIPAQTRPRDGQVRSFANHLATIEADLHLDRVEDPVELARAVHAQVERQRRSSEHMKRALFERAAGTFLTLGRLHHGLFEVERTVPNYTFANSIPLRFEVLSGDGWLVEKVLVTTPVNLPIGILLTAIRYNGQIVFNFNYKTSASTHAETEELRREFQAAIEELTRHQ